MNGQPPNAIGAALKNPSDSGVNIFLKRRLFSNDRTSSQTALEYLAIGNPTDVLANVGGEFNLRSGGMASAASFEWEVDTLANLGTLGGFLGTGEVLPRGAPYTRNLEVMLEPGNGFGVRITGAGANLSQAARIGITLEWYEEDVN